MLVGVGATALRKIQSPALDNHDRRLHQIWEKWAQSAADVFPRGDLIFAIRRIDA